MWTSTARRADRLAFGGAKASQHVRQRVVALVTGVFVDRLGRACQRQLAFPRPRERGRIVDLELVEQRLRVEQTEALDQVQVAVPAEVAAGVSVESAAVVEVRGVDDER